MTHISDDELLLFYYGELDDKEIGRQIAQSPALRARFDALVADLERLEMAPPPAPAAELGERIWSRVEGQIEPRPRRAPATPTKTSNAASWWHWLTTPRLSLGGAAAMASIAGLAFWLGSTGPLPNSPPPSIAQQAAPLELAQSRLIAQRVGEHLGEAELLLTDIANGQGDPALHGDWAEAMLLSNRIYRRTAAAHGAPGLAKVLQELEPTLVEIANHPERSTDVDASLLFRIRIMNREQSHDNEPI